MPRGFQRCLYVTDDGRQYALMVDADSAADPNRGWQAIPPDVLEFAPRGFLPRIVVGVDELGNVRQTRVGTVTCDLWTFTVTTWVLQGSDGQQHTVRALSRKAERQVKPRAAALP